MIQNASVLIAELTCLALEAKERDDSRTALELIERAIKLDDGQTDLWELSSDILLELGKQSRALETIHKAIYLDPENVSLLLKLGDIYASLDEKAQAREIFLKASKKSPYNPEIFNRLMKLSEAGIPDSLGKMKFNGLFLNGSTEKCSFCKYPVLKDYNLDTGEKKTFCKCVFVEQN